MNFQSDHDEIKAMMKIEYEKLRLYFEGLSTSTLEANYNGKMMKAQLTAYCGAYRKDKSMFDKGVRNYNKYSIIMLDDMREGGNIAVLIGKIEDVNIGKCKYKNDEGYRQAGITIKYNYDFLNITLPQIFTQVNYWR